MFYFLLFRLTSGNGGTHIHLKSNEKLNMNKWNFIFISLFNDSIDLTVNCGKKISETLSGSGIHVQVVSPSFLGGIPPTRRMK